MNKERAVTIGHLHGLSLRATPAALASALFMAAGLFLFLYKILRWRPWAALSGGILATISHFLSDLWHHAGHARAAQMTGFPMEGVTFFGPIGRSAYPRNEGLLPAETHIQRALGGPIFSLLLALVTGVMALLLRPLGGLPLFLAAFNFLDNLLVLTVGALLPLGFTDGSTILTWWSQLQGYRRVSI